MVGPLGAGKSSILDAIAFALYGKTPIVGHATGDLINQRSDRALVELTFQVEGQVWRAVRGQTRKGAAPYQLQRLDDAGEVAETVATSKAAMNAQIEQLLGLSFDAFCRSVLLAQNQFSLFLTSTTGDRDKVLKGIFGLDVIDRALGEAKGRRDLADFELREYDHRRSEIAEAKQRLATAKERMKEAKARLDALKKASSAIRKQVKIIEQTTEAEQVQERKLEKLNAISTRIPESDELERAASSVERAEKAGAAEQTAVAAAEKAHEETVAALQAVRKETGGAKALTEARGLMAQAVDRDAQAAREGKRARDARTAAEKAAAHLEGEKGALSQLEARAVAADEVLEAAAAEASTARERLQDARHAEMALTLRSTLSQGEACPVCEQPVHKMPPAGKAPKVTEAQKALEKAAGAEASARAAGRGAAEALAASRKSLESAEKDAVRCATDLVAAEDSATQAAAVLAKTRGELERLLGKGDPTEILASAEKALADAERSEEATSVVLAEAKDALEETRRIAADGKRELSALATRLAGAAGGLEISPEIEPTPASLRAAFDTVGATWKKLHRAESKALATARTATTTARQALAEVLDELGIADATAFETALQEAAIEHGASETGVNLLKESIASEGELKGKIAATLSRREVLDRLAGDLTPSNFLRFLLEEDRATLAQLGSEHCESLTNGRYRFTEDGEFNIVDLAAAEGKRKADSLSGGETFLASLALALALAEMVTRGGGRLDAFFLDEGFGSLDPEHMDLAMEGIDRLVADSGDRLVVLVSHVPEMRERIEDLIVLDKDPATSETVVRSGASLRPGSSDDVTQPGPVRGR